MRNTFVLASLILAAGCTGTRGAPGGPTTTQSNNNNNNTSSGPPADGGNIANCDPSNAPANGDQDSDGYTPAQGDCDDCNPLINPGAVQIPGDPTDYACNGMPGVVATCTSPAATSPTATAMAQAMDLCDSRFLTNAAFNGPSDPQARRVESAFGVINPRLNATMSLVSSGIAASESDSGYDQADGQDPGTDLGNTFANPLPNLPGVAGCGQTQPTDVNDYTEIVLSLKAPTNASSFSFDFQFFSAEYSTYVCSEFNDEFLVLQQSQAFPTPTNIAFDSQNNAITINSGFFTVCENDPSVPQADHCTSPVSGINGTGFEVAGGLSDGIPGGSTGWLTTTSPVNPGESFTLHFIIFDEGDGILNSDALIDNFRWGTTSTPPAPTTTPIQ